MPAQTLTLLVTSSLKTQDVPSSRCRARSMSVLGLIWNSACQLPVGGACSSLTSQRDHCSFPKIALGRERERERMEMDRHIACVAELELAYLALDRSSQHQLCRPRAQKRLPQSRLTC